MRNFVVDLGNKIISCLGSFLLHMDTASCFLFLFLKGIIFTSVFYKFTECCNVVKSDLVLSSCHAWLHFAGPRLKCNFNVRIIQHVLHCNALNVQVIS